MLWSNLKVFPFALLYQKHRGLFSNLHHENLLKLLQVSSMCVPGFCSWMSVILSLSLCIFSFGCSGLSCDFTSLIDLRVVDFSVCLTFPSRAWSDGFQATDKPDWISSTLLFPFWFCCFCFQIYYFLPFT